MLKFAKFRTYHSLEIATLCLSCSVSRRIRRSSRWSVVVGHIFSVVFAHIAPHHSQVSDSSGFGSGGTSIPVTVLQSSDSSCYNASQNVQVSWFFNIDPPGGLTQCSSSRIWWEQSSVNGCVPPLV